MHVRDVILIQDEADLPNDGEERFKKIHFQTSDGEQKEEERSKKAEEEEDSDEHNNDALSHEQDANEDETITVEIDNEQNASDSGNNMEEV